MLSAVPTTKRANAATPSGLGYDRRQISCTMSRELIEGCERWTEDRQTERHSDRMQRDPTRCLWLCMLAGSQCTGEEHDSPLPSLPGTAAHTRSPRAEMKEIRPEKKEKRQYVNGICMRQESEMLAVHVVHCEHLTIV